MEFYIKLEIILMDKQTLANYCSSKQIKMQSQTRLNMRLIS